MQWKMFSKNVTLVFYAHHTSLQQLLFRVVQLSFLIEKLPEQLYFPRIAPYASVSLNLLMILWSIKLIMLSQSLDKLLA